MLNYDPPEFGKSSVIDGLYIGAMDDAAGNKSYSAVFAHYESGSIYFYPLTDPVVDSRHFRFFPMMSGWANILKSQFEQDDGVRLVYLSGASESVFPQLGKTIEVNEAFNWVQRLDDSCFPVIIPNWMRDLECLPDETNRYIKNVGKDAEKITVARILRLQGR